MSYALVISSFPIFKVKSDSSPLVVSRRNVLPIHQHKSDGLIYWGNLNWILTWIFAEQQRGSLEVCCLSSFVIQIPKPIDVSLWSLNRLSFSILHLNTGKKSPYWELPSLRTSAWLCVASKWSSEALLRPTNCRAALRISCLVSYVGFIVALLNRHVVSESFNRHPTRLVSLYALILIEIYASRCVELNNFHIYLHFARTTYSYFSNRYVWYLSNSFMLQSS